MPTKHLIILLVFLVSNACIPTKESTVSTDAVSRRIIGPATNYADSAGFDTLEVQQSLQATRALAWSTFAKVVADSERTISRPDGSSLAIRIPSLFTWYSPEDVNRLMNFSFNQLSPADIAAGIPVSEEQWQRSQILLGEELDTLPLPLQKKWARFFADGTTPDKATLIGVTGLNRTLFSPDLIGSVTRSYADLHNCFPAGVKPQPETASARCWKQPLARSSVMVKTNWLHTESGFRSYATDANSLQALMQKENSSWADAAVTAPAPAPGSIVTATNNGKTFVLGGVHIVTKELEDWLWISAWWSDTPNQDFGEDRPEHVKALGAPWNQYKICAVSSYVQDPAELEAMAQTHPSLAAAYRAVLKQSGASWCSNPYIEKGAGNHETNCIGCHQFAGTSVFQSDVLSDAKRFPNLGKNKQRPDFPSDYIWSATQGAMSWQATLDNLLPTRPSPSRD